MPNTIRDRQTAGLFFGRGAFTEIARLRKCVAAERRDQRAERARSPDWPAAAVPMKLPNRTALIAGLALTVATAAGIAVGSTGMRHFDPALTGYAIGALMAAFAVGYRFAV